MVQDWFVFEKGNFWMLFDLATMPPEVQINKEETVMALLWRGTE